MRDGASVEVGRHRTDPDDPDALLAWLEPALSDRDDLFPDPVRFRRELGREGLTFGRADAALDAAWRLLRDDPEVKVKRDLWDGLLREAYGAPVGDDRLFLQHTYLTVVAKALAARVLDLPLGDAAAILSGRSLEEAGIYGAVEGDFFDWVLLDEAGRDLVVRVARQVARFSLREVETDVLKALYESLIDPEQRRDLGEYYTPDWLAARMVKAVIDQPLEQVVLDPACGSGTFLFQALRRLVAAGHEAGIADGAIVVMAAARVRGLDVHPVAVIIARVTWLLALGPAIEAREAALHVPVYLGDAMQWNLSRIGNVDEVMVPVPGEGPLAIPAGITESQALLDDALEAMSDAPTLAPVAGVEPADATLLGQTYARMLALKRAGRNGIWPFVLRNLLRPVWLSRKAHRADVLIGNPPWVAYRHLAPEMKEQMRDACRAANLWVGGKLATQQDLSALFWARGKERYLKVGGTIAFVLPYAALNRPAFAGLRAGSYGGSSVRIGEAWNLSLLREIFPTSSCVLIGRRLPPSPLSAQVECFTGAIRRDADEAEAEADRTLARQTVPWPPMATLEGASPYRARFRQGATIVPRRFFLVEREQAGRLGASRAAPRVRGRAGPMDKRPWLNVEPPSGPVEAQFLRPLILGETVAPFRLLSPSLAVLPTDGAALLDSAGAAASGHRHLAAWLRDIETKWAEHSSGGARTERMLDRLNYGRALSGQLIGASSKIVYTKASTRLSAAVVEDPSVVIDHKAYWAPARRLDEAGYLCVIINSNEVLQRVIPMQARGWRDPRDFDKLIWELPIPAFDAALPLHCELAQAGAEAEREAATVALPDGDFRRKRRAIRDALAASGLAARMEALVATLLAG